MTTALARPTVHPVAFTVRRLLRAQAKPLGWFWLIVLAAVLTVTSILAINGITHISVVSFARQAGIWFPYSLGIFVATAYIRAHVAGGLTRRTLVWGALATAVVVALGNALIMATALLAERLVHEALDWGWVLQDAALDPSGGSWPAMLLDYGLTYVVANVSGLLTGIVFYAAGSRWGNTAGVWWGIVTLPLTVGPIFAVLGIIAGLNGPWPDRAAAYLIPDVEAAAAASLGLAVAMAVAFALLVRRTPIARARN